MTDQAGTDEQEADKKPAGESDDDILKEARERYTACSQNESDDRVSAKDDLLFLSGGVNQWDATDAALRTLQRRPMITVNNLPTFLHQITNEHRQNKLGGKVRPVDEGADEQTAEVIQGVVRHIEYDSNASVATTTAVNSAAAIGFGYFRLVTDHESETSFDQKIMFKRIRNALSVHVDPLSQEPDGSDMKFCFIDSLEPRKEFEREYPKANANSSNLIGQELYKGWFTQETVLICEYYRIKGVEDILCELTDGTKGFKSELPPERHAEIVVLPNGKPKERKTTRYTVEWFKMTGADILERTIIKCEWIPVFPVYGDEIDIEGRVVRSGIIRNSKDSFKMYNVCITTAIEEVATRAKSPYIMAEGQDEGHEAQWANVNRIPYSSIKYKPTTVGDLLVPPPQRSPMADIPAGWLSMTMHFSDNKKATTGLFDSSLGAKGTATSGIQEREQQAQGDLANFHYSDNLSISYRHALRCIVSMIPHYYDGARMVRILGEDEESEVVPINQPFERKNPKTGAIETVTHDLTVGKFDVTVSSGPSYSTKRQEAAEFMTDAMQSAKDPAAAAVLTYLAIKNYDIPGATEASDMLKKLLPPGIAPEDKDAPKDVIQTHKGPLPVEQVPQAIQMMDAKIQELMAQGPELQKQSDQVKAEATKVDQAKASLDAQRAEIAAAERELRLSEQLAHKTIEADDARSEADRTKIIADMKMLVNDAVSRLEGMKQQAEQVKAGEDGAAVEAKNQQAEAQNQEVSKMQQALLEQLAQAIALLKAPRKTNTTLQVDASGMPIGSTSEEVIA